MNNILLSILILSAGLLTFDASASEVGQPAPQFTLPAISKEGNVSLDQFSGKVVYVDFWASWCAPCRTSFPLLNQLYQKLKDQGFEVVAINLDENPDNAKKFLETYPVTFNVARDGTGETADQFVVESMPTSFIVDRQGIIRNIHHGFVTDDILEIESKITQLLAKQ